MDFCVHNVIHHNKHVQKSCTVTHNKNKYFHITASQNTGAAVPLPL